MKKINETCISKKKLREMGIQILHKMETKKL